MPKLNQIIAIEKNVKKRCAHEMHEINKKLKRNNLLSGISRTYRPKDENGEILPPEGTRVQLKAEEAIQDVIQVLGELFDITLTKDLANCEAKADIIIGERVLIKQVPVSYLLFLEKQLDALASFIHSLPVLDAAEVWNFDPSTNTYAIEAIQTLRTKKVPRNHVKAEATDKHPAQVEVYYEDITIGYWQTIKFSGALPAQRVHELQKRIARLQQAVKFAREEANSYEVNEEKVSERLFSYLFEEV